MLFYELTDMHAYVCLYMCTYIYECYLPTVVPLAVMFLALARAKSPETARNTNLHSCASSTLNAIQNEMKSCANDEYQEGVVRVRMQIVKEEKVVKIATFDSNISVRSGDDLAS